MAEPKKIIDIQNVIVICGFCTVSRINLGTMDLGGKSDGERFDVLAPMANEKGWKLVGQPGDRAWCCPACDRINAEKASEVLAPFSDSSKCQKCGHADVAVLHNGGVQYTPYSGIEYIARTCNRCKFKWKELPLDQAPPRSRSRLATLAKRLKTIFGTDRHEQQ